MFNEFNRLSKSVRPMIESVNKSFRPDPDAGKLWLNLITFWPNCRTVARNKVRGKTAAQKHVRKPPAKRKHARFHFRSRTSAWPFGLEESQRENCIPARRQRTFQEDCCQSHHGKTTELRALPSEDWNVRAGLDDDEDPENDGTGRQNGQLWEGLPPVPLIGIQQLLSSIYLQGFWGFGAVLFS